MYIMKKILSLTCLLLSAYALQAQLKVYTDIVTGKSGLKDATGKVIVKNIYDALVFKDDMIAVNLGGKADRPGTVYGGLWGLMDSTGKKLTDIVYEKIGTFYSGLVAVQKNGKWGFMNKAGKLVVPARYDEVASFSEGLAKIVVNGEAGYVNQSGAEVIKPQFTFADFFSQGLAAVSMEGGDDAKAKYGYIDKKGNVVISYQFSSATYFEKDGTARVKKDGIAYRIDKTGKEVK